MGRHHLSILSGLPGIAHVCGCELSAERRGVEEREPDRLLELVREWPREEDVGDVGLAALDAGRRVGVGRGPREEPNEARFVGVHGRMGRFYCRQDPGNSKKNRTGQEK